MDDQSNLIARRTALERLSAELTEDLLRRLVAYCAVKASRRWWYGLRSASGASMVGGHKPEDIVQIVVLKTIRGIQEGPGIGRRIWDGDRDLFDYFTSQIDSEISNLGESWTNRKVRRSTQLADGSGRSEAAFLDTVVSHTEDTPETMALRCEEEQRADEFLSGFLDSLDGDDGLLIAVIGEIVDGAQKPAEIADALQVSVQEIYRAKKRLKRRFEAYRGVQVEIGVN